MKTNEFIVKAGKAENVQILKSMLNVKEYLPFNKKKALAKRIVEDSIIEENGFVRIDEISKYLIFTIGVLEAYTDLEFDEDLDIAAEEYDVLAKENKLNTIISFFESEYNTLLSLTQMEVDYILQQNSVEYQTAKLFDEVGSAVNRLSDILADKVDSFDISNLGISMEQIAQLSEFLGQYKQ